MGTQAPIAVVPIANFDPALVLKPCAGGVVWRLLFSSEEPCHLTCYLCVTCAVIYRIRTSLSARALRGMRGFRCLIAKCTLTILVFRPLSAPVDLAPGIELLYSKCSRSTKRTRSAVYPLRQRVSQPSFRKMVVPADVLKFYRHQT